MPRETFAKAQARDDYGLPWVQAREVGWTGEGLRRQMDWKWREGGRGMGRDDAPAAGATQGRSRVVWFFVKIYFIHERHRERERERDIGRGRSRMLAESPMQDSIPDPGIRP